MDRSRGRRWLAPPSLALFLVFGAPLPAAAVCNVIPGTPDQFAGRDGTLDHPFAVPGDPVGIALGPGCSPLGFAEPAEDNVVSVVFTPPHGAARNLAVVGDCEELRDAIDGCKEATGVTPACFDAPGPGDVSALRFFVDGHGRKLLRFRFPDTDALVGGPDDGVTLSGPATIVVTRRDSATPLPCELLRPAKTCADVRNDLACFDDLFEADGTCTPTQPRTVFAHFTALPHRNDYQALCESDCPDGRVSCATCTGLADEARFTVDAAGNLLIPMDWSGILYRPNTIPVPRLLSAESSVPAFPGGSPIRIPGNSFLSSFSPEGRRIDPFFEPRRPPNALGALHLFGSADAPWGVLRIARRSASFDECRGGDNAGLPCQTADDCPGGTCADSTCFLDGVRTGTACRDDGDCIPPSECGPSFFDFSTRLLNGVGPAAVHQPEFTARAQDPVPLDGLIGGGPMYALVKAEAILNEDLNGDGDTFDDVIELFDRATGAILPIGDEREPPDGPWPGRAVVRVREAPFTFPGVTVAGDLVAFLESEPAQHHADANDNGRIADSILRLYRVGDSKAVQLDTGPRTVAVDPSPLVNARSVAIVNGQVFFRTPEWAAVPEVTTALPIAPVRSPALSANGRFVAFASPARDLVPDDTNDAYDVFVYDLERGETRRVSVSSESAEAQHSRHGSGYGGTVAISGDGRFVAFASDAMDLVPRHQGSNAFASPNEVFLHDRDADENGTYDEPGGITTIGVSGGEEVIDDFTLSGDGRYVIFTTFDGDFVYDRSSGTRSPLDVGRAYVGMSDDGRFLLYNDLGVSVLDRDPDGNGIFDDAGGTSTEVVSVSNDGRETTGRSKSGLISKDGRFVVFGSLAPELVPGDTNGADDVFVRDRRNASTMRVSLTFEGFQVARPFIGRTSTAPSPTAMSPDGRFVAMADHNVTANSALAPGDEGCRLSGCQNAYLTDRLTGMVREVSLSNEGTSFDDEATPIAVSAGGRVVAFVTHDADSTLFLRHPANQKLTETVLQTFDTTSQQLTSLCPATVVAVHESSQPGVGPLVAFLRPEEAGDADGCPTGPDLNGDGDVGDEVLHFWQSGQSVQNLARAATDLALSEKYLAALVSEAAQGGIDLNGDGDALDTVVEVHRIGDSSSAWTSTGQAADSIGVAGSFVVMLTPEAAQQRDLNGDGDQGDHVLQIYDADTGVLINVAQAAEEFVLSPTLVAFRTRAASQGKPAAEDDPAPRELPGKLQVYELATGRLFDTGQQVLPCRFEACDPRFPYRAFEHTVKFLTFERDQDEDLNRDDDEDDIVLQLFNVSQAGDAVPCWDVSKVPTPKSFYGRTTLTTSGVFSAPLSSLAAVGGGICTLTLEACVPQEPQEGCGTCFLPPGGCVAPVPASPCDPRCDQGSCTPYCGTGEFCVPLAPGALGQCYRVEEQTCQRDAECSSPEATCIPKPSSLSRVTSPLADPSGVGAFMGAGRCVVREGVDGEPHERGTCNSNADCDRIVENAVCENALAGTAAPDSDRDEIPDAVDNCPAVSNPGQEEGEDSPLNGIGDACDQAPLHAEAVSFETARFDATRECDEDPTCGCDDGNPCTIDVCHQTLGCKNSLVSCDDRDDCTVDHCDEDVGCAHDAVSCYAAALCELRNALDAESCPDVHQAVAGRLASAEALMAAAEHELPEKEGPARRKMSAARSQLVKARQAARRVDRTRPLYPCRDRIVAALEAASARVKTLRRHPLTCSCD